MANVGKYVDRSPDIRSAGFLRRCTETAEDTLKEYHAEEVAEAIVKTKCKSAGSAGRNLYPQSPFMPTDGMKDIFSTELKKSRFVEFREKFWEDMFFKKPELGKVFQLHAKPDYITNENTIFGAGTNRSEPCYELVLPKKQLIDINREYMKWHDKYILSHNHYFPSERICRHYDLKNFNPANTFGVRSNADITGGNVRKCLTRCERIIVIKKAQKDFLDMSIGKLGKRSKRYEGIVPPDALLGLYLPRDDCDAKALIENINPCVKKTKLIESIAHINRLRRKLFSRMNFHIHDFKAALELLDGKNTGYLPLLTIFEAAYSLRIHMDPDKIRTAAKLFELFVDNDVKTECINYEKFLKILQIQYPLPKTGNISTMPDNVYNKETTYRELCKDIKKKPIEAKSSITKISKSEETTGKDLISPSIALQFGLAQSDFNELRPKEELCRIFKRIITDPNLFEKIWQQAKMHLNPVNDCISVNELRLMLNTIE